MPAHTQPQATTSLLLGDTTILTEEDAFIQGYQQGYRHFRLTSWGKTLTDLDIYNLLAKNITDVLHPSRMNAGFVVGWVKALHEQGSNTIHTLRQSTHMSNER